LGDYAFQGLAAGSYQVGFSLGSAAIGGEVAPPEDDGYLTQYYDGVANRPEARTLTLSGEQMLGGIDAALQVPAPPLPPAAPVPAASNLIQAAVPISEPTKPAPLHCKKGTVKATAHGAPKCVKRPVKKSAKKHKKPKKKLGRHGKKNSAKPKKSS
jgi:hypothetical protein